MGLAPFLIIVIAVGGLLGTDTRIAILQHAQASFSHEVAEIIRIVFLNAEVLRVSTFSGMTGALFLIFTASIVFSRFRYSFDVIYGHRIPEYRRSNSEMLLDKLFAMFAVLCGAAILIASLGLMAYVELLMGPGVKEPFVTRLLVLVANFCLYFLLFVGLHHTAPTVRPRVSESIKMAALSAIFFIIGNMLLSKYLKTVAANSVYGAAGTLLVFLIWAFYSAFTIFLSAEVFLFFRTLGKKDESLE